MLKKALLILAILLSVLGITGAILFRIFIKPNYEKEPDLKGEIITQNIEVGGIIRTFLWYKPLDLSNVDAILFVLHGSTGDGIGMRKQTGYGFDKLADEKGFIPVYPTGYFNHWNDCRASADYKANLDQIDDIAFLKAIEKTISQEMEVSFKFRLATGFSNGGHFCYKLAFEVPDWITAIAPIAANIPVDENLDCNKKGQFVPLFLINGTADPVNPYEGGLVSILGNDSRGEVLSTDETIQYWTKLGHCTIDPINSLVPDLQPSDKSHIEQSDWLCDSLPRVRLFKIVEGGHTVPNKNTILPKILGPTNQDVDAAEEIWSFFEQVINKAHD